MKIEVTRSFYGRPDESTEEFTLYLMGAVIDVPDAFADMVVEKDLARVIATKISTKKDAFNETE